MDLGRVAYYLDIWRDFMNYDDNKLGYKTKSSGFLSGGIHSIDDLEDSIDEPAARIVNTCVDSLPTMQKNAIYIIYLGNKSMMDTRVLEYYYDNALMMLQRKLKEKNLY